MNTTTTGQGKPKFAELLQLIEDHAESSQSKSITINPIKGRPDKEWIIGEYDWRLVQELFPADRPEANNVEYLTVITPHPERSKRKPYALPIGRFIMDQMLREIGVKFPKGYVAMFKDGNPFNLTRTNLLLRSASGECHRKNTFATHWIVEIRQCAVQNGQCPRQAILNHVSSDNDPKEEAA